MKKFTILSLVFVMALALSITPALATSYNWNNQDVTIHNVNLGTAVFNRVVTSSNTGNNISYGRVSRVSTGYAYADSLVSNNVNSNTTVVTTNRCGYCFDDARVRVGNRNMFTRVGNNIYTGANTGNNISEGRNSRVYTGNARTISTVVNVVNSNVTRVR